MLLAELAVLLAVLAGLLAVLAVLLVERRGAAYPCEAVEAAPWRLCSGRAKPGAARSCQVPAPAMRKSARRDEAHTAGANAASRVSLVHAQQSTARCAQPRGRPRCEGTMRL